MVWVDFENREQNEIVVSIRNNLRDMKGLFAERIKTDEIPLKIHPSLLKKRQSGTLEFEAVGLKDRRLWLDTQTVPLYDDTDATISMLGITSDGNNA